MRTSQAALALFSRVNSHGENEYLTQWNKAWQAYSLIGGHVEVGETFRACCVREVVEELECDAAQFLVATKPIITLRFQEFSNALA